MFTIRPSSVKTFFECGQKYFFEQISEPDNVIPTHWRAFVGTAVHKGIETWFETENSSQASEKAQKSFSENTEEYLEKGGKIIPCRLKEGVELIERSLKFFLEDFSFPKPSHSEVSLLWNLPLIHADFPARLKGTVDYYDEKTQVLGDFKTSRLVKKIDDHMLQLALYKHLLEKNGYKVKEVYIWQIVPYEGLFTYPLELDVSFALKQLGFLYDALITHHTQGKRLPPNILFRGNPYSTLCSIEFCGNFPTCPFIQR